MINDTDWLSLLLDSTKNHVEYGGKRLPSFPEPQLQLNTTGREGQGAVEDAFSFYLQCRKYFDLMNVPLTANKSLLDFGVGWGRVLRCFIRDLGHENVFGTDVMPEFIDLCRRLFSSNNFIVNEPYPPTPIPSQRFDFIVGYSVFSHLSEQACKAWIDEFYRILKPNGVVAVTTRSRDFFGICEKLKETPATGYTLALSNLFDDFEVARLQYDTGQFVHSNIPGVGGGGKMNSSFYGESFIPMSYAQSKYRSKFSLEHFVSDKNTPDQSILFFKKQG